MGKATGILALILIAAGCGQGGGGGGGIDAETAYAAFRESALEHYQAGEIREAIRYVGRALATSPGIREPYEMASSMHIEIGADEDAIQFFDIITRWENVQDIPWPWYFKGYHLYRTKRFLEALDAFRLAAERGGDEADVQYRLGLVLEATGDEMGAMKALDAAWELDPRVAGAAAAFSRILRTRGQLHEAELIIMRALEFSPTDPGLIHSLARLRIDQERPELAEMALQRILELDPDHMESRSVLIELLEGSGRKEEAARHRRVLDRANDYRIGKMALTASAGQAGDPAASRALAELELTEGDYREAIRWFDSARLAGDRSDAVLAGKAEALFRLELLKEGDETLASVHEVSSGHVALARAVRYAGGGDMARVREYLDRAMQEAPENREFLRRASDLYSLLGDEEEAERLRERAGSVPRSWER